MHPSLHTGAPEAMARVSLTAPAVPNPGQMTGTPAPGRLTLQPAGLGVAFRAPRPPRPPVASPDALILPRPVPHLLWDEEGRGAKAQSLYNNRRHGECTKQMEEAVVHTAIGTGAWVAPSA